MVLWVYLSTNLILARILEHPQKVVLGQTGDELIDSNFETRAINGFERDLRLRVRRRPNRVRADFDGCVCPYGAVDQMLERELIRTA